MKIRLGVAFGGNLGLNGDYEARKVNISGFHKIPLKGALWGH